MLVQLQFPVVGMYGSLAEELPKNLDYQYFWPYDAPTRYASDNITALAFAQ